MRIFPIIAALSLLFCLTGKGADEIPHPPKNVVLKPTFMTGYDSFSGGTTFVCKIPGQEGIFLLTAQHLFGTACGLERDYTWEEVPKMFTAMTALSMEDTKVFITSTSPLTIPGAHALSKEGYNKDVAGYRVSAETKTEFLQMAATRPGTGDVVFLYARQRGKDALEMMRATVVKSTETEFEYVFDDAGINLAGTSGGPVLNSKGEVVALNIGGGKVGGGKLVGIGNSCTSILEMMKLAK